MQTVQPIRDKWKGTLTDRERFNRQMHHQPIDRCFNREFGYWNEKFEKWALFKDNGIINNDQADLFFNFDLMPVVSTPWMYPLYESKVVETRKDTQLLINPDGLLAEIPRDGHDTIPHYIQSSIQSPEDWRRCKELRFNREDPARCIDISVLQRTHPTDRNYPLGVHCGSMIGKVRDLLTFEGLAYAIYDYPEMVEDMVETSCLLVEDFLDQLQGHIQFDFASGWEDICCKSGPLVPMSFMKEIVVPRYKRLRKKLQAMGVDIWFTDCDGDLRPIIPFLLDSGINCLFPFEVNSSGHPGDVLAKYGPELRILGGVDKMKLGEGPTAIKAYLESLQPWVDQGGFIPFCDHRCPPNVKPEV
jgi:uroporphyrinogen decarboxylase